MFNFKLNRNIDLDVKQMISMAEWHKPQRRVWAKIISLLVTVTFVLPYMTWAFEASSYPAAQQPIKYNNQPIKIPDKLGTVTQSFSGQDRVVVCVQDLHCNYEVQNNIANMIDDLAGKHGLNLVTVEGESILINVSKLADFPLEQVKKDTAHYLMKQGKITGAELYAATGKHPIRLEGIETQALYDDNRKNVMSFLNNESQGYIFDLRESLDELKGNIYTKALAQIDEKKQAFREGDISVLKYSVYMYDYGVRHKLDMKRYANLARYVSRRQNIFPENVDSDDLFNELDQLDRHLRSGLYTTADQRIMDIILHRLDIMEKLINISAAPEDLAEFRKNPAGFKVKSFLEFISRHDDEGLFMLDAEVYKLDSYLEEVRAFYRVADERSLAFVENVIARMDKHQTKIAMMVTGGYHKEEVLKELERHNISYVCVKPCLCHHDIVNPYFVLLRNKRTPLEKLLAQNQNIMGLESSFMHDAGLFNTMMAHLFFQETTKVGLDNGKTNIPELSAFVTKAMANHPEANPDWNNAKMDEASGTVIVPFPALQASLVVRRLGQGISLKTLAKHQRVFAGFEFSMLDNVSLAGIEAQLMQGRVVQGGMVKVALATMAQVMPIMAGRAMLAVPSILPKIQSFSIGQSLDGLQSGLKQMMQMGPGAMLNRAQNRLDGGLQRAVKSLSPAMPYLIGSAVIAIGAGLFIFAGLNVWALGGFVIAGAVVIASPQIGRFADTIWNRSIRSPGMSRLTPVMAVFAALIGMVMTPPGARGDKTGEVSLEDKYYTLEKDATEVDSASAVFGLDVKIHKITKKIKDLTRIIENIPSFVALMKKVKYAHIFIHLGRPGGVYDATKTVALIMYALIEIYGKAFKKAGLNVLIARLPYNPDDVKELFKNEDVEFDKAVAGIDSEIDKITSELELLKSDLTREEAGSRSYETKHYEVAVKNLALDKKRMDLARLASGRYKKENSEMQIMFIYENIRSYASEESVYEDIRIVFYEKLMEVTGAEYHVNSAPPDNHRPKKVSLEIGKRLSEMGKYFLAPSVFSDLAKVAKFEKITGPKLHLFGGAKIDKLNNIADLLERVIKRERKEDKIVLDGYIGKICWGLKHNIPGVKEYVIRELGRTKAEKVFESARELYESDQVVLPTDGTLREKIGTKIIIVDSKKEEIDLYKYSVVELNSERIGDFQTLDKIKDNGPQTRKNTRGIIEDHKWKGKFVNGSPGVFEEAVKDGDQVTPGAKGGFQQGTIDLTLALVKAHERAKEGEANYVYIVEAGGETRTQGLVAVGVDGMTEERITAIPMILGGGAGIEAVAKGLDKMDVLNWARKPEAVVQDVPKALAQVFLLAAGLAAGLVILAISRILGIDLGISPELGVVASFVPLMLRGGKSAEEQIQKEITKQLKKNQYQTATLEQIAKENNIEVKVAGEILEELWLKNDNIDTVKLDHDGGIGYAWCPISVAVQITRQGPENFPVGVPMRVIIGHSEVRDFLKLTIAEQRALLEKYLAAGYKITSPFGDFPALLAGKDYVASGHRKFPVTYDRIVAKAKELGEKDIEYQNLLDEVRQVAQIEAWENLGEKYQEYLSLFEVKEGSNEDAKLNAAKEFIIKEISTIHEINSQVKELFKVNKNMSLTQVLYQITDKAYEPIEGIRGEAISMEIGKLRLEKMLDAFVDTGIPENLGRKELLSYAKELDIEDVTMPSDVAITLLREIYEQKLKDIIIYGGGANEKNIVAVGKSWGGAFIGRAILKVQGALEIALAASTSKGKKLTVINNLKAAKIGSLTEYKKALEAAEMDLEKDVKVSFGVSMLDIKAAFAQMQGKEGADELFTDFSKAELPIEITIQAGEGVATQPVGAFTGHFPAELLAQSGVTHALINPLEDYAKIQVRNLLAAGITPVVMLKGNEENMRKNLVVKFGDEKGKQIKITGDVDELTPIHAVRSVAAKARAQAEVKDVSREKLKSAESDHAFTAFSGYVSGVITYLSGLGLWSLFWAAIGHGVMAGMSPLAYIAYTGILVVPGLYLIISGFIFWRMDGAVADAMLEARWTEEKDKEEQQQRFGGFADFGKFKEAKEVYQKWLNEKPEGKDVQQTRKSLARYSAIAWRSGDKDKEGVSITQDEAAMAILLRDNSKVHALVMYHEGFKNHFFGMLVLLPGVKFVMDRFREMSLVQKAVVVIGVVVLELVIPTILVGGMLMWTPIFLAVGIGMVVLPFVRTTMRQSLGLGILFLAGEFIFIRLSQVLPSYYHILKFVTVPAAIFAVYFMIKFLWSSWLGFDLSKAKVTTSVVLARDKQTLKVVVKLVSGIIGKYVIPAGTSSGILEAATAGIEKAQENVRKIHEKIIKLKLKADQVKEIGRAMIEMGRKELGAEATLGYQMAAADAAANQIYPKQGLYRFIRELFPHLVSVKDIITKGMYNLTNGGLHAENELDMQEFMVTTFGRTIEESNTMAKNIDSTLGNIYIALGLKADTGDGGEGELRGKEGGYKVPNLNNKNLERIFNSIEELKKNDTGNALENLNLEKLKREFEAGELGIHEFVLNCFVAAIENAGYEASTTGKVGTVALAFDLAASSMLVEGHIDLYHYEGKQITSKQLTDILEGWVKKYPIRSIEDGLGEQDWEGWMDQVKRLGDKCLLIGDDLLVTQASQLIEFYERLRDAEMLDKDGKVIPNLGILIKLNQNGFLSTGVDTAKIRLDNLEELKKEENYLGTLEVIDLAQKMGFKVIVSHRSREAKAEEENGKIADLAAAVGADSLKAGDPVQPARDVFWTRLAKIDAIERGGVLRRALLLKLLVAASVVAAVVFAVYAFLKTGDSPPAAPAWAALPVLITLKDTLAKVKKLGAGIVDKVLKWELEAEPVKTTESTTETTTTPDTEGLIEDTLGVNEPYMIKIWKGFKVLHGVHGDMIKFGAWAMNRLTSARAVDVNIATVNKNPKIWSLLIRALISKPAELNYASGISLDVSGNLRGSYTVRPNFGGIKTIKVSASVLNILDQGRGTGMIAGLKYIVAEALFIHTVKYQVMSYNRMVRSRKDTKELLVELKTTEANVLNKLALARLSKISLSDNVLAKKDGKVTITSAMLAKVLLAVLPDRANVQTQAKRAINEVLQKGGGELTLKGLLQASLSKKTADVPMLAAINGLLKATKRGPEDATLVAVMIDLINGKDRVIEAGPVDEDIRTVELIGGMPQETASIMLNMISEAGKSDKVDQSLLAALANAVKALRNEAAGGMLAELSKEEGQLLASFIQQARTRAPADSCLGRTSEGLYIHADTIGYEVKKINNVDVSVPVVVAAKTKTEKTVDIAKLVSEKEITADVPLSVFTQAAPLPAELKASSAQEKRLAWAMERLGRILPQGAQSYTSRKAANLSPERGLLNLIRTLEAGLMKAGIAQNLGLAEITDEAKALAFLNTNDALPIALRRLVTARSGKTFSEALAEAAGCMAKCIDPDTLGVAPTKVERNTAQDMLNVLFFSEFFSQLGGKLMAIAEVDANDKMWASSLFAGLELQARKIMVPKAMLTVSGYKGTFGRFVDTLETLPVTVNYEQLRRILQRCLRTLEGSA